MVQLEQAHCSMRMAREEDTGQQVPGHCGATRAAQTAYLDFDERHKKKKKMYILGFQLLAAQPNPNQ